MWYGSWMSLCTRTRTLFLPSFIIDTLVPYLTYLSVTNEPIDWSMGYGLWSIPVDVLQTNREYFTKPPLLHRHD